MASSIWLWMLLVLFTAGLMGSLKAYEFKVGGNQGWVLNPSENYNLWASRMRFQVNDTIFFKYNKGTDSVLVVNKQDYDTCNTQNPIMKMDGGDSVFKFDRSGPFYFISGNKDNCDKGQKLIVVVLAVRNIKKPTPPPTPPPAESPSPAGKTPATAPSPAEKTPASSPTPESPSPATTPAKSPATSPVSPSPATTTPAKSPATSTESPSPATAESSPPASSTLSPGATPAESDIAPNPSGDTGEASVGTPPRPSSSPAFIPPVFMVLLVTLVSSVAMGSFVASPWDNMGIF